jgi:hypothetical protein
MNCKMWDTSASSHRVTSDRITRAWSSYLSARHIHKSLLLEPGVAGVTIGKTREWQRWLLKAGCYPYSPFQMTSAMRHASPESERSERTIAPQLSSKVKSERIPQRLYHWSIREHIYKNPFPPLYTSYRPPPTSAQTCFSSIPAPISNLAPVLALTSSSVAPGISSIRVIFPAFRSISKTACVAS